MGLTNRVLTSFSSEDLEDQIDNVLGFMEDSQEHLRAMQFSTCVIGTEVHYSVIMVYGSEG